VLRRRPSKRRLLLYVAGAALATLVLAQLLLPRIAASKIHSRLDRYGAVKSVKVSAWPAIELLWGHADSVDVHAGALALAPARIAPLLHEAKGAASLKLRATSVRLGALRLTEVGLDKPDLSDAQLIAGMAKHPIAIERPIVVNGARAALGRPPEAVLKIL